MDTITTENFTKTLFQVLHLKWDHLAESRDLLTSIIIEEEDIHTIMEDIVFSMSQFLKFVRDSKGIESGLDDVTPYFVDRDDHYVFHIGNSKSSKMAFMISVDFENDEYSFRQSIGGESLSEGCHDLDHLKVVILSYFSAFYDNFYGNLSGEE